MGHRTPGTTRAEFEAHRRERDLRHALGLELRNQIEDAGISQAALARAAHMSRAQVGRILAGTVSPSLYALAAMSVALDGRLVMRIEPNTGPRIRDRIQARILEALIRILHARWMRFIEVPVYRPVRGVIDSVLHDPNQGVAIAAEIHSQIRRFEQQQRWANAKADGLLNGSELPLAQVTGERPAISRLLILRSTQANRDLTRTLEASFRTAYPGRTEDAVRALTTADAPWPGPTLIWARVDGTVAEILPTPPRGVPVGR
jgi:transcriptional regulator with XRE-family HTH domain